MCINVSVVSCLISVKHLVGESCVFSSSVLFIENVQFWLYWPPCRFFPPSVYCTHFQHLCLYLNKLQSDCPTPSPSSLIATLKKKRSMAPLQDISSDVPFDIFFDLWTCYLNKQDLHFTHISYCWFFFFLFFSWWEKNHKSFETLRLSMQTCKITLVINFG